MKTEPIRVPDEGELWSNGNDWYVERGDHMLMVGMSYLKQADSVASIREALADFWQFKLRQGGTMRTLSPNPSTPTEGIRDGADGWVLREESCKAAVCRVVSARLSMAEEELNKAKYDLEEFMKTSPKALSNV